MKTPLAGFRQRIAKGLPYLAWVSFALALVGGAILPGTPVGIAISRAIGAFIWTWVPPVAFCAMVVGIVLDTVRDFIPDRVAVYSAALAPTFGGAIHGTLASKVVEFAKWVASLMTRPLTQWSGIDTAPGVAVLALVLAFVIADRTMKDKRSLRGASA